MQLIIFIGTRVGDKAIVHDLMGFLVGTYDELMDRVFPDRQRERGRNREECHLLTLPPSFYILRQGSCHGV